MPYGLTNAPAVFQAFINEIFKDLIDLYVVIYIDDILIYSASYDNHVHHVTTVLTWLLCHQLYVKAKKCEFHKDSIKFLGYVILKRGVEMDCSKVRAVTDWPELTTVKDLQRFLGSLNVYRRFIHNYSSIANLLTSFLQGKLRRLQWMEQAWATFTQLKRSFTTAPILRHPDPSHPFIIKVDASSCGIRAVISQHHWDPGKVYPCAYFSRKLISAEVNYDVGNQELLSIKTALEEWQHWLEGAKHPFLVLMDHRNLKYLCNGRQLKPQQISTPSLSEPILSCSIVLAPVRWKLVEEIQQAHINELPLPSFPAMKLYIHTSLRPWDVVDYIESCTTCAQSQTSLQLLMGLMESMPVPCQPWSHMVVDFVIDLPDYTGFTMILVAIIIQ
ncbi:hypothetical protein QTP86_002303 [Hemibagrus guttatus]|nr:hypothetical protein QTP86_002303 [Hemibagrus guttatus]